MPPLTPKVTGAAACPRCGGHGSPPPLRMICPACDGTGAKRATWVAVNAHEATLTLGPIEICAWEMEAGGGYAWIAQGCSATVGSACGWSTLALAQASAVRWLRRTIAEMAAACPEVP